MQVILLGGTFLVYIHVVIGKGMGGVCTGLHINLSESIVHSKTKFSCNTQASPGVQLSVL